MCGLVGLWNFRGPIDPAELDRFTDALAHRGPDGRGTHVDGSFALGHRRLAILDLSEAGAQPMSYGGADGRRYWIAYNGEVYNFLELRRELAARGHAFRTQTDTEVILAAYAEWGADCLHRFNGMFAFALWDSVERQLFLARDRFGVKPLYFGMIGATLAFASEIKAFLALSQFTPAMNQKVAAAAAENPLGIEGAGTETIMAGVFRLPAGHTMTVTAAGSSRFVRWWATLENLPQVPPRYDDQVAAFRELMIDSVRLRMRSDVPIGTCLSGGLDSSAIASTMAHIAERTGAGERAAKEWRHAFVATFPGTVLDEAQFARTVIGHIAAVPHVWTFNQDAALELVLSSVWATEEINAGINVPVWAIYREMRRAGVLVSLDGHGGDEVLGGYTWYLDWPAREVNQRLQDDINANVLPAILRNYDRAAMAHGVEVRMPLLDWRVVTFAAALPVEAKMGGGYTKRILRDAMRGIMPEEIRIRRQKIGFNAPMMEWFNSGFAPVMRQVFAHPLWRSSPHWNAPELTAEIERRVAARSWSMNDWGFGLTVWNCFNIVLWHALFVERDTSRFAVPRVA